MVIIKLHAGVMLLQGGTIKNGALFFCPYLRQLLTDF